MSAEDDLARFGGMGAEALIARLRAAEDVCVLYGWTGIHDQTDREKALYELWNKWYNLAGHDAADPASNPHLTDEVISDLARQRDATREATLRHYFGDEAVDGKAVE